jgi:hypothetical protein
VIWAGDVGRPPHRERAHHENGRQQNRGSHPTNV